MFRRNCWQYFIWGWEPVAMVSVWSFCVGSFDRLIFQSDLSVYSWWFPPQGVETATDTAQWVRSIRWLVDDASNNGFARWIKVVPLSLMAVSAKVLTYWSYDRVPVSITHTAKASAPLFNVSLAWLIYSRKHALPVYMSLIPIVLGVSMASVSEFNINDLAFVGVMCAIGSSLIGVAQNMYSKYLLRNNLVADSINVRQKKMLLNCCVISEIQ